MHRMAAVYSFFLGPVTLRITAILPHTRGNTPAMFHVSHFGGFRCRGLPNREFQPQIPVLVVCAPNREKVRLQQCVPCVSDAGDLAAHLARYTSELDIEVVHPTLFSFNLLANSSGSPDHFELPSLYLM